MVNSDLDVPVVRLGMAPRKSNVSMQQFQDHWGSQHAEVAGQLPGLRSYVQYRVVLRDGRPALPYTGFDACSQMEFDSWQGMQDAFTSPVFVKEIQDDEAKFVDKSRFTGVGGRRNIVFGGGEASECDAPAVRVILWRARSSVDELVAALADRLSAAGATGLRLLINDAQRSQGVLPVAADVVEFATFDSVRDATDSLTDPGVNNPVWTMAAAGQSVGAMVATAHRIL
jgi:uncharacterized protein (TIGR02118 family)